MATSGSRAIGALTRGVRPTIRAQTTYNGSRRNLELPGGAIQQDTLPPVMTTSSESSASSSIPGDPELEELRPPRSVQIAYLRPLKRTPKYRIPTCNLQLRSYSVRNLEFFTTFALRAAYYLKLPAVGPVPLPKHVQRWTVPRGHFVHKKSQENFERITLRRLIQIQDGHPETVQMWLAYLRKRAYFGVGMKANVWEFDKLGIGREMDAIAENVQPAHERWSDEFPVATPAPEVQAQIDKWMKEFGNAKATSMTSEEYLMNDDIALGIEEAPTANPEAIISQSSVELPEQITPEATLTSAAALPDSGETAASLETSIKKTDMPNNGVATTAAPATGPTSEANTSTSETKPARDVSRAAIIEDILAQIESQATAAAKLESETSSAEKTTDAQASQAGSHLESEKLSTIEPVVATEGPQTKEAPSSKDKTAASIGSSLEAEIPPTTQTYLAPKTPNSATGPAKSAAVEEQPQPPAPSDVDTSKETTIPEADPSIEPSTEEAKEAEEEDEKQPLGDMPKTPS